MYIYIYIPPVYYSNCIDQETGEFYEAREIYHDQDTVWLTEYAYCIGMNTTVHAYEPLLFR